MILFYQPDLNSDQGTLDAEESLHCVKVLRKKQGDHISITDGKGHLFTAEITSADKRKCAFRIVEKKIVEKNSNGYIHIAIAPTKNLDRIEWFVEKAVEIGVDEISFVLCKHSERKTLKLERILRKSTSALKQSLKFHATTINPLIPFSEFIEGQRGNDSNKCIAYVDQENPLNLKQAHQAQEDTTILIGPEGDFSDDEVQLALDNGFKKVSLGKSRLRTETAGIVACHTLNFMNEII